MSDKTIYDQVLEKIGNFMDFIKLKMGDTLKLNSNSNTNDMLAQSNIPLADSKEVKMIITKLLSDKFQSTIPGIRNEFITIVGIEDNDSVFETFLSRRKEEVINKYYKLLLNNLIKPITTFLDNDEIKYNLEQWVDKTFGEEDILKIGRYFDLFYELYSYKDEE